MQPTQRTNFHTSSTNPAPTMDDFFYAAKANNRELLGRLLKDEPPLSVKMSDQALQEAAKRGDIDSVRFFIENGIQHQEGALKSAAEFGHMEIVKYLVAQPSVKPGSFKSAIEIARNKGCHDVVEFLLQAESRLCALDILNILDNEHTISSNKGGSLNKLGIARQLTMTIAQTSGIIAPGLTACVATTLLKVGLCQELSQRFALEYCIKYQRNDISLILLSNPNEGYKKEDHMFVQIGTICVPEALLMGKTGIYCETKKGVNQDLTAFFSANKNGIFADPLLHCAGNLDGELTPLLEYCNKYNLTHVIGVRSFHDTPGFVENAVVIKNNAIAIAEKLNDQLGIAKPPSRANVFPQLKIEQQLNAINHLGIYKKKDLDLMLLCCNKMWEKEAAKGASELEEFRCALERLLSDMKNYPDLCLACFDLIGTDGTKYEELFSSFFSLQQTANEYLRNFYVA